MRRRISEATWRLRQWAGWSARLRIAGRTTALDNLVDLSGGFRRVASGFQFTEGPVWLRGDGRLLFSDIPADRVYGLDRSGQLAVVHEPSGHANGLAVDASGRLIACEHGPRRVTRRDAGGAVSVLAAVWDGKRLNSPNDVVVAPDGAVWFTDPPYGINPAQQELPFQGVFRISRDGVLGLARSDFDRPNGLAFSPDGRRLYVADSSDRRHLRKFAVEPDGQLTDGGVFIDMAGRDAGVPDGLKVDSSGNVYATGPGGIWVVDPAGRHLGTLLIPETASNCAWGDDDWCGLYVTAETSVYHLRVRTPGLAPASWRTP